MLLLVVLSLWRSRDNRGARDRRLKCQHMSGRGCPLIIVSDGERESKKKEALGGGKIVEG